ncbi:MAG TPA: hypothetical protein PK939_03400 [Bacteroidales bacterium]|nr:hypothetical protein [Bacteroidales bacterium]
MKKENTSRVIKLIMAFAIFWMVIGDLITYHQEKIFGTNFYEHHSPFTKPSGKDDGKTTHLKISKDFDKQSWHIIGLPGFFIADCLLPIPDFSCYIKPKPYLLLRHRSLSPVITHRGPPSLV